MKKAILKRKGAKSLSQLARELGVTRQTLYNAMNGVNRPSYKLLKALELIEA